MKNEMDESSYIILAKVAEAKQLPSLLSEVKSIDCCTSVCLDLMQLWTCVLFLVES